MTARDGRTRPRVAQRAASEEDGDAGQPTLGLSTKTGDRRGASSPSMRFDQGDGPIPKSRDAELDHRRRNKQNQNESHGTIENARFGRGGVAPVVSPRHRSWRGSAAATNPSATADARTLRAKRKKEKIGISVSTGKGGRVSVSRSAAFPLQSRCRPSQPGQLENEAKEAAALGRQGWGRWRKGRHRGSVRVDELLWARPSAARLQDPEQTLTAARGFPASS
ncbi:MAG: hypothetical protein BJ554DRAFT_2796, partial [Olpidium bornovanus]